MSSPSSSFNIISPIDGKSIIRAVSYNSPSEVDSILSSAVKAQSIWNEIPLSNRIIIIERALQAFKLEKDQLAEELTSLIGRPIKHAGGEIDRFIERANYLKNVANDALAEVITKKESINTDTHHTTYHTCSIKKEPLGVILLIGAWNFPYNVTVNTLIPGLLAGNAVILKPAPQTSPTAHNLVRIFENVAGFPTGLLAAIDLPNERIDGELIANPIIKYISLIGSVQAGRTVNIASAACRPHDFLKVSLELGGCDAAYVRADIGDESGFLESTVRELVNGAFHNAGQSCCGVQRIFVDAKIVDRFVESFVNTTKREIKLGDPRNLETTLGPLVSVHAAEMVRTAIGPNLGCNLLPSPSTVSAGAEISQYLGQYPCAGYIEPVILYNPPADSIVLKQEIFGPVVAIVPVQTDDEAIYRINNDSHYGLTASIWSKDCQLVESKLAEKLEVGTVFLNGCDSVDPSIPWSGIKNSGLGFTLSKMVYDQVTRPKSLNFTWTEFIPS